MEVAGCVDHGHPGGACRDTSGLGRLSYGSVSLSPASGSVQRAFLTGLSLLLGAAGTKDPAGVLLCYAAYQALKWPSSLGSFSVLSCQCQGIPGEGKAAVMASLTQQYRLASMAAGLSSTVISLVSPQAISL